VRAYGGTVRAGTVKDLVRCDHDGFQVLLADGDRVLARRLLVATGLRDELPNIPGLADRWARDVLHCPYCHGWEVRDQQLGVVWNGPDTVRYAQIIRQWSYDVVLFAPSDTLTPDQHFQLVARAIDVVEGTVSEVLVNSDHLTGVQMDDGQVIPRAALFVPPRFVPNNDLLVGLDCDLDERDWVITSANGATAWLASGWRAI
jgi:thioredoxin reductase